MSRRIPLWATLLPLVLGILVWAWVWRGYAAGFRSELQKVLPPDTQIETGGFPYRLEARVANLDAGLDAGALQGRLTAGELVVNRVPWQRDRQVLNLLHPVAELRLLPLEGAGVQVSAPEAQASLHLDGRRIVRLSMVWEQPQIASGLLPGGATARHFEAHFREMPADAAAGPDAARAGIVLSGEDVRLGGGTPLGLAVEAEVQATAPLSSFAGWADGGAVAIRSAVLADATGEIARFKGRLAPDGQGGLHLDGSIETVCPATVRAAIQGLAGPVEMRARKPVTMAVSGRYPVGLTTPAPDASKPPPPVRGQEPPCPRLRAG